MFLDVLPHCGHHIAEFIGCRRVGVGFEQTDEGGAVYFPGMIQWKNSVNLPLG